MGRVLNQKDISGCAISGIMSESGWRFSGEMIIQSIANMHERANGLGGGFAAYGINRRYLANFGYHCALQTDTEVIAYMFDLLVRKHGLVLGMACTAMAPPFWTQIERLAQEEQEAAKALRMVYGGALLNGPFSVVVGHSRGIIGFNDRIKLRPMVAARKDDVLYIASEEAAIREVCRNPDALWHAEGGVPIIGWLNGKAGDVEVAQMAG